MVNRRKEIQQTTCEREKKNQQAGSRKHEIQSIESTRFFQMDVAIFNVYVHTDSSRSREEAENKDTHVNNDNSCCNAQCKERKRQSHTSD